MIRIAPSRRLKESAELRFGALLAIGGHHQHLDVHQPRGRRRVAGGNHLVHHKQLRVRGSGLAAIGKNLLGHAVGPIVYDVFHDVRRRAGRDAETCLRKPGGPGFKPAR
jgi:hypothetical protein